MKTFLDSESIESYAAILECVLSDSAEKPENFEKVLLDAFGPDKDRPDPDELIEDFREEAKKRKQYRVETRDLLRRLKLLAANNETLATFVDDIEESPTSKVNHIDSVPNADLPKPLETASRKRAGEILQVPYITDAEMDTVSSYMKGRWKAADVNQFVDKLNSTIVLKYEMMRKPKKNLANDKWVMINDFKMQETAATKGFFFCTKEDMQRLTDYQFKNTSHRFIEILRHCRRIREIREQKLVKFTLMPN